MKQVPSSAYGTNYPQVKLNTCVTCMNTVEGVVLKPYMCDYVRWHTLIHMYSVYTHLLFYTYVHVCIHIAPIVS